MKISQYLIIFFLLAKKNPSTLKGQDFQINNMRVLYLQHIEAAFLQTRFVVIF